jgi:hypothetical protein
MRICRCGLKLGSSIPQRISLIPGDKSIKLLMKSVRCSGVRDVIDGAPPERCIPTLKKTEHIFSSAVLSQQEATNRVKKSGTQALTKVKPK